MTHVLTDHARALLEAPLKTPNPAETLGRAALLYVALVMSTGFDGLVPRRTKRLAEQLAVPESTIERWLARLEGAKLIEIVSHSPYLTIRLLFWPAVQENPALSASNSELSHKEVPVSSNSNSSGNAEAIALSGNTGIGGQGEREQLREGIEAALPEADAAEIDRILAHYPEVVLRKALDRLKKTPPAKIRKSKTALFRFLITKFSQEIDVNDL